MDFYSLGFIFAIVMVSGVIAYFADIFGRKMGKKRYTVLGLRPKHTAAISTVLLGMALSMLTIGLGLLFFAPVRQWVFLGAKASEMLAEQQIKVTAGEQKIREDAKKEQALQNSIKSLRSQVEGAKGTLAAEQRQETKAIASIASLRATQVRLSRDLAASQRNIHEKTQKILALDTKQQQLVADLSKESLELEKSNQLIKDGRKANAVLLTKNEGLLALIAKTTDDLKKTEVRKKDVDSQLSDLLKDYDAKLKERDLIAGQLRDADKELTRTEGLLAQRTSQYNQLYTDTFHDEQITRLSPMIYSRGQEICRMPIPANLSANLADEKINQLIRKASLAADNHHAKAWSDGYFAEVTGDRNVTAEAEKSQVASKITGSQDEMVLVAFASLNTYEGEPVSVSLESLPNPIIYHRNDELAEADIDGSVATEPPIVRQLEALASKVQEKARKDKMIPQDEGSFGSLSYDQVLDLVADIKTMGRFVRVHAVAADDTRAADPLKLTFRIR